MNKDKLKLILDDLLIPGGSVQNGWRAACELLVSRAKSTGAIKMGSFTLASGAHSNFYFDGRILTLDSVASALIAALVLHKMIAAEANTCGGPAVGAVPIIGAVTALAGSRGVPVNGVFTRSTSKKHGTQKQVEGAIVDDMRVLLVEDTLTTGGSAIAAMDIISTQTGANVVSAVSVMDRMSGGREKLLEKGIPFQALMEMRDSGEIVASELRE